MTMLPPDFDAFDDYDDPFVPLGQGVDEESAPDFEAHLRRMEMIEHALELTEEGGDVTDSLPTYYDDMLMRLIDSVPLE